MQITRIGRLKETELAGDLLYGRQLANRTISYINIYQNIYIKMWDQSSRSLNILRQLLLLLCDVTDEISRHAAKAAKRRKIKGCQSNPHNFHSCCSLMWQMKYLTMNTSLLQLLLNIRLNISFFEDEISQHDYQMKYLGMNTSLLLQLLNIGLKIYFLWI